MDEQIKEIMKSNLEKHQVSQELRARTIKKILAAEEQEKESRGFIRDRLNLKVARYIATVCVLGLVIASGATLPSYKEVDKLVVINPSGLGEEKGSKKEPEVLNGVADEKSDHGATGNAMEANDSLHKEQEVKGSELANEVGILMGGGQGSHSYNSPINYNSLRFAETAPIESSKDISLNFCTSGEVTIMKFSEEFLKESVLLFKGTVTNVYFKNYQFQVYIDKLKENNIVPGQAQTVVYEVKIDDILYSQEDVRVGDIIKIEDYAYGNEFEEQMSLVGLKINHQYIIPVEEAGETIAYKNGNGYLPSNYYATGNIARDGKYTTFYHFAPQIEVTLDNQYLFRDEWTSLINSKTRDVVIDNPKPSWIKMKLREDDDFIEDLKSLIEKYK